MSRFYDHQAFSINQTFQLGEFASRHLTQVLRTKISDEIVVFNGKGGEYQAVIQDIKKQTVTIEIIGFNPREAESPLTIHLAQAISRGDKMDYTIQKATELGVASITPLITERCGVKLEAERLEKKQQHWQTVAISACEQCGRNRIPIVHVPQRLKDWLPCAPESLRLVLHHRAAQALSDYSFISQAVTLLIGSEGGLTSEEINQSEHFYFQPLVLGPRILRTETAAVTALSILQYEWGDL